MLGRIDPSDHRGGAGSRRRLLADLPQDHPAAVACRAWSSAPSSSRVMVLGEFATAAALSGRKVNLLGNIIVTQVGLAQMGVRRGGRRGPDDPDGRGGRGSPARRRSEEGALIMEAARPQARPWPSTRRSSSSFSMVRSSCWPSCRSRQGPEGGPQFPIIEWSTYWYQHLFGLTPPSRIAPLPIERGACSARSPGRHDHGRLDCSGRHRRRRPSAASSRARASSST